MQHMVKAQMKIQQMAFMLIAIVIFFVLVGMFVLVLKFSDIRQGAEMLKDKNARLLATRIANSPEFSCGTSFGGSKKTNCVDADKLMLLKEEIRNYDNFWGVKNIEVGKLYPEENRDIECKLRDTYPDCGIINLRSVDITSGSSNYVTICRKEPTENGYYDLCELGIITVNPLEIYENE